ncbi:hypothetical protein UT300013_10700 [Paraclostridium sordellii]
MTSKIYVGIILLNNGNSKKIKTMKRRVSIKCSHSELRVVKAQYEVYTEEHLGVSNRNNFRVGLDGRSRYRPLSKA